MSNLPEGWIKGNTRYFIDHISGLWRISRSSIKEKMVYTLWKKVDGKWALYGNHDSADEADDYRLMNRQKRDSK